MSQWTADSLVAPVSGYEEPAFLLHAAWDGEVATHVQPIRR